MTFVSDHVAKRFIIHSPQHHNYNNILNLFIEFALNIHCDITVPPGREW